jgi:hypothetical protein
MEQLAWVVETEAVLPRLEVQKLGADELGAATVLEMLLDDLVHRLLQLLSNLEGRHGGRLHHEPDDLEDSFLEVLVVLVRHHCLEGIVCHGGSGAVRVMVVRRREKAQSGEAEIPTKLGGKVAWRRKNFEEVGARFLQGILVGGSWKFKLAWKEGRARIVLEESGNTKVFDTQLEMHWHWGSTLKLENGIHDA